MPRRRLPRFLRSPGFTLIELLVVIAIIAILAAILFPVFAKARDRARMTTCRSNLKQLGMAFGMYADNWDETLPLWTRTDLDAAGWQNSWDIVLQPYLKSHAVVVCPSDDRSKAVVHPTYGPLVRSYSYPGNLGGDWSPYVADAKSMGDVKRPTDTVLLGERQMEECAPAQPANWASYAVFDALGKNPRQTCDEGEEVDFHRHDGIANFLFVDGHVVSKNGKPQGPYPNFPGYTVNKFGAAACSYKDPLPQ
jgi:prepilin-type N-terminal cleavage/methylation domain-containing protein/prepilin-type processing-associated H-X9-DG protein